jgi:hypothetical protein
MTNTKSQFDDAKVPAVPAACGLADPISDFAARLDVFFGDANPAQAHVFARLDLTNDDSLRALPNLHLSGRLIGPQCEFAHTLSARIPFVDRSSEQSLLAEAVVPDPCFWTPELPFLYRAVIEVQREGEVIASCERAFGIRRLGVRGRWLHFDGKRHILRGVSQSGLMENEAEFARESWTTIVSSRPDERHCEFASRRGVLLIADLIASHRNSTAKEIAIELRRLSRWPAVGFALLHTDQKLPADFHMTARNLLLAQYVTVNDTLISAFWADLAFVELTDPAEFAHKTSGLNTAVVAVRQQINSPSIEQSRAECDRLQSDLAPFGDFAGYIV